MTNREFFLQLCAAEYPRFVGVLQAVPGDRLDYRPHEKSRSAQELLGHLIAHETDLLQLAETGTIHHQIMVPFSDLQDALRIYDDAHRQVMEKFAALSEDEWMRTGQFLVQGHLVMEQPRADLAWMLLLDALHHRGQISTYLRPMGGKVPPIYGPSADTAPAVVTT